MSRESDNFIDLTDVLGWGYLDIKELSKYMNIAINFDIQPCDIKEEVEELFPTTAHQDINQWFYCYLSRIFYTFIPKLDDWIKDNYPLIYERKYIEDELKYLEGNFNPLINCLDSWFNNFLDELYPRDSDECYREALKLLLKDKK